MFLFLCFSTPHSAPRKHRHLWFNNASMNLMLKLRSLKRTLSYFNINERWYLCLEATLNDFIGKRFHIWIFRYRWQKRRNLQNSASYHMCTWLKHLTRTAFRALMCNVCFTTVHFGESFTKNLFLISPWEKLNHGYLWHTAAAFGRALDQSLKTNRKANPFIYLAGIY